MCNDREKTPIFGGSSGSVKCSCHGRYERLFPVSPTGSPFGGSTPLPIPTRAPLAAIPTPCERLAIAATTSITVRLPNPPAVIGRVRHNCHRHTCHFSYPALSLGTSCIQHSSLAMLLPPSTKT